MAQDYLEPFVAAPILVDSLDDSPIDFPVFQVIDVQYSFLKVYMCTELLCMLMNWRRYFQGFAAPTTQVNIFTQASGR